MKKEKEPLLPEQIEIDEFEKLFIITSAKLNASGEVDDRSYNPDDFDDICNFAKFKRDYPELFDNETITQTEKDLNYYMIPITIKVSDLEIKAFVMVDNEGNGLYIVLPDGKVAPAQELKELTNIEKFASKGALTDEEIGELLKGNKGIKDIAAMINADELDIILLQEKAAAKVRAKGLKPEELLKDDEEKEEEKKKEEEELVQEEKDEQELEEEAREEDERAGIDFDIAQQIAAQKGCKVHQIRFRELYRPEIIKERLGKDFDNYRGKLAVARITYGFKEEFIVLDKTNGRILIDDRIADPQMMDLVPKWPYATKMPIKKDEGRSYISYIDEKGRMKEAKYLNNGKYIDMAKDERERFIAEVQIANKELSEAIEQYQKNNTMENWKKVRDAMAKRVALDKLYGVHQNQKDITIKTLDSTIDETIGEVGGPQRIRKPRTLDDDDGYDPRDPRARY